MSQTEGSSWVGMVVVGFLACAFFAALVLGAQTVAWSWGPALVFLGVATATAGFVKHSVRPGWVLRSLLALALAWIGFRAWQSPVVDAARADGLLALSFLAMAWSVARLGSDPRALRWFSGALAVAVLGNVGMALVQYARPESVWPYPTKPAAAPSGFFGHYNYFANFVGGAGVLLLARAILARDGLGWRLLFGLGFLAAAVGVPLSGSRGGTLALGIGLGLLLVGLGVVAWRVRSKWAPVLLVVLPLLVVGVGVGGWVVFQEVQAERTAARRSTALDIADNLARLRWLDLAQKVTARHPWTGGGSRAFSWERNQAWDVAELGRGEENESFVHNELVQTMTDYGLIGAGLVILVMGGMFWRVFSRLFMGGEREGAGPDATAVGVLAAGGVWFLSPVRAVAP
ncbi:MAG: O-antigen ligase family protein, partial [Verrucomicrobiales bacterium]